MCVNGRRLALIRSANFLASLVARCTSMTISDLPFEKMNEFTVATWPLKTSTDIRLAACDGAVKFTSKISAACAAILIKRTICVSTFWTNARAVIGLEDVRRSAHRKLCHLRRRHSCSKSAAFPASRRDSIRLVVTVMSALASSTHCSTLRTL